MAFTQITAPAGQQANELLSADNSIPERHIVVATIRNAAPRLGLSASVIATLDAMLSCLAPKRCHHTVFASNATLTFRRNGISERTLRRHAAQLQELGLLVRHDSPNRKRYTKHNSSEGRALRFGFDLSPLFARLGEIAALAAEVLSERERIDYMRTKIRVAAHAALAKSPNDEAALSVLRVLRRKLSLLDCEQILKSLPVAEVEAEAPLVSDTPSAAPMTASDGQIVRHHHKSTKEHIDKESRTHEKERPSTSKETQITIAELLSACPEAAQFSLRKIETPHDVIAHARTLAPMIGITNQNYDAAHERLGPLRAAVTVWAIMQFHEKIKAVGAYFRSITTGAKSAGFSPEKLIRRLAMAQNYAG